MEKILEGQRIGGAALHPAQLVFQRADAHGILDRDLEALGPDRLHHEIRRARPHGGDHGINRAMRGLHDDWCFDAFFAQRREHAHAVEVRHDEIKHHG